MGALLLLLAIAMLVAGAASTYFGSAIIEVGRGWTMVLSGTIAMAGGGLLLGLSAVLRRLGRIERTARRIGDRIEAFLEAAPARSEAPVSQPTAVRVDTPAPAVAPAPVAEPVSPSPPPPPTVHPKTVVGSYNSGVNSYDMYADGSIRAETPTGEFRFASIEEFRNFVSTGAGAAAPAPKAPLQPGPTAPATPNGASAPPPPSIAASDGPADPKIAAARTSPSPAPQPAAPTAEMAKA